MISLLSALAFYSHIGLISAISGLLTQYVLLSHILCVTLAYAGLLAASVIFVTTQFSLSVMDWMFVHLPHTSSYVKILTLNVMILRGRTLGRWLSHEGGALMNGISALKETPERSLTLSVTWGQSEKMVIYEPGGGSSPDTETTRALILDSPATRNVRNLLFRLPSLW